MKILRDLCLITTIFSVLSASSAYACTPAGTNWSQKKQYLQMIGGFNVNLTARTVQATIKNVAPSNTCPIPVGIATYKKSTENLSDQKIYDYYNTSDHGMDLWPGAQITFTITLPDCAAQIDLFVGSAITTPFTSGNTYASQDRLINAYHTNTANHFAGGQQLPPPAPQLCQCPCTVLTPTPTPKSPPKCDAGGPYTQGLACSATPVSIKLISKSTDPKYGITHAWSSNCPSSTFNNPTNWNPTLNLVTFSGNGQALSCKVMLTVTNSIGLTSTCEAPVLGGVCNIDCAGTPNGTAKPDACGVCNGDGSSCVECSGEDITDSQLNLDIAAAKLRKTVASLNRLYETAAKNTRNVKTLASARKQIRKDNEKATNLYSTLWTTAYTSFPSTILTCNSSLCVQVSNVGIKSGVTANTAQLRSIAQSVQKRLLKVRGIKTTSAGQKLIRKAAKLVQDAKNLEAKTAAELRAIPASSSVCS